MTTFGLTPAGFVPKSADDVLQGVRAALSAQFGTDLSDSPVFGALAEIFSAPVAEAWQLLNAVYASGNRATASGASLDGIGELIDVFRLPGVPTKVNALLSGDEGTRVPAGSLAATASGKDLFQALQDTLITANAAVAATVRVVSAAEQNYTVTVNKIPYTVTQSGVTAYAAAHPTFDIESDDDDFLTSLSLSGGSIAVGKVLYWAMFKTQDAYLNEYINFQLFNDPGKQQPPVATYLCTDPDPVFPLDITLEAANDSGISGSLTLQGYAEDTDAGNKITVVLTPNGIAGLLFTALSGEGLPFTKRNNGDGTFSISSKDGATPFSVSVNSANGALSVASFQCLQAYASVENDAVPCIAGDLSTIVSPVRGWNAITNPNEATPLGQPVESDDALRLRISESPRMNSSATAEAIKERLVQEVTGVRHAFVFPNFSDEPDGDGRPPHTLEVIVDAPTDLDTKKAVAQKILELKPVGITTVTTNNGPSIPAIDTQGRPHTIYFSTPTPLYVWIYVDVLETDDTLLPHDWMTEVQNAVMNLAGTYSIGQSVLMQKFYGAILAVPGIESIELLFTTTDLPNPTPPPALETYDDASIFGIIGPMRPKQLAVFSNQYPQLMIEKTG